MKVELLVVVSTVSRVRTGQDRTGQDVDGGSLFGFMVFYDFGCFPRLCVGVWLLCFSVWWICGGGQVRGRGDCFSSYEYGVYFVWYRSGFFS